MLEASTLAIAVVAVCQRSVLGLSRWLLSVIGQYCGYEGSKALTEVGNWSLGMVAVC